MKITDRMIPLGLLIAVGCVSPVFGALSCTGGTFFAETGLDPTNAHQQDGEACITIGAGTITIQVQSDDTVVSVIPSILDGISLQLSGAAAGIAFNPTNPAVATNFIDCTGTSCVTTPTFVDWSGGSSTPPSPYEWGVVTGASGGPITTTFSTTNPALLAGAGSLRPAGIVGTLASTSAETGLGGNGHNDYLLGPVTFNLTFTGAAPTVNGVTFYWDTTGNAQPGVLNGTPFGSPVPEPASELLLGAGLLVVAKVVKSRLHGV